MQNATIIVADDHPLFRAALLQSLGQVLESPQLIEADCFASVRKAAEASVDVDLVLLDLQMPGANGFSGLAYLRGRYPALPVVVVSAHEETAVIYRAIDYGASGFIPKSTAMLELVAALQAVLAGEVWLPPGLSARPGQASDAAMDYAHRLASLTSQQLRVLELMGSGLLNKQIADRLDVAEATVKAHVTAILRKLDLHSRTQAALAYQSMAIEQQELSG